MTIFVIFTILLATGSASAQIYELADTPNSLVRGYANDAAYDPVHDCYFVVSGDSDLVGGFIDRSGNPISDAVVVEAGGRPSYLFVSVTYSPDVSDGAGGTGGFLVIWSPVARSDTLVAQLVSFPGQLVGSPQTIYSTPEQGLSLIAGDVAYSETSRSFVGALAYFNRGQNAWPVDVSSRVLRLNLDGQPIGESALSIDPSQSCHPEFFLGCDIHVAWNPVSREFGTLYDEGNDKAIARISADGRVVSRTLLPGPGGSFGGIAVNTATGNYLAVAGQYPDIVNGAELDSGGTVVATGEVTSRLTTDSSNAGRLDLSYSASSGTFLLVGRSGTPPGGASADLLELNQHGVPLSSTLTLPDFYYALSAHPTAAQWMISVWRRTTIIGTATPFGGSTARLSGCTTADPFTAIGGGTCVNGGWVPHGHPVAPPTSTPSPAPGTCPTPDPFVTLGGGVCVNGGWVPRGHPLAGGS